MLYFKNSMGKIFKKFRKTTQKITTIIIQIILFVFYFIFITPFAIFTKLFTDYLNIKSEPHWQDSNNIFDVSDFLSEQ